MSLGMVRQLAGLAHATWRLLVPLLFEQEAPPAAAPGLDINRMLSLDQRVTGDQFEAIIRPYPRLFGNPDTDAHSWETEYILFADMLRFVWCHEWMHGLAGHAKAAQEGLGIPGIAEMDASVTGEAARITRAMEFEADALSIDALRHQIAAGLDIPGRIVSFSGGLEDRLYYLVLAISIMITHLSVLERARPAADRSHPPAALRCLRLWDMLYEWLAQAAFAAGMKRLAGTAVSTIFRLSEVCPAFVDLQPVTPSLFHTPTMDRLRNKMDQYHELVMEIDSHLIRHNINAAVADLKPHRAP